MITTQLLRPESIVVVGASNNVHKPGGAILKNLINGGYQGELRAVNPKETEVQGVPAFADVKELPDTDLAVLAVPAVMCPDIVETLASEKQTRAFIILSAGFGEETREGALLEERILETVNKYGASLIGPNCIGLMNTWHHSVFSQPIPNLNSKGVDLISSSGATAVFILESAVTKGLQFNSVWSVGNAKQIGVEDVLQFMDENFDPEKDSRIKLLYIESIHNPDRLLFHASSLIRKGCKIAAIKAGSSESGSRAASSHTGAIASSDSAVEALFRKAGIVRCFSREELTTVGCIFTLPELKGKNFAIITHAGGPGVMLTDALSKGGLNVPKLEGELAVSQTLEKYFIVRIAWVFGLNGKNFIKTMLNVGKTHDTVRVVNDQIGTPTYTYDLARLLVDMNETEKYGYYHATNEGGYISWYDFTKEIYRQAGYKTAVLPVSTEEYGLSKAARPFNSRLDKSKLLEAGFTPLPTWQDALSRYLKEIEQ